MNSNIDKLNATSTTLLTYFNNLSNTSTLNVNNLNVSGATFFNNPRTCVSSLNVSGNSNLNNLNVSGSSYFFGNRFGQQNIYGVAFLPQFDPSLSNRSINISTRGTGNVNLNAVGNGSLICNISGTSRMIMNYNSVCINSLFHVSGSATLNHSTTLVSSLKHSRGRAHL